MRLWGTITSWKVVNDHVEAVFNGTVTYAGGDHKKGESWGLSAELNGVKLVLPMKSTYFFEKGSKDNTGSKVNTIDSSRDKAESIYGKGKVVLIAIHGPKITFGERLEEISAGGGTLSLLRDTLSGTD